QGSNVPNPDEAVPSFVSGAMAKAGKGLLEGTLQAGTSAVSDKLLDLVGLGGKSAADKGKDTRDYLAAAFPELNAWEGRHDGGYYTVKDCVTIDVLPRTPGNNVYVGFMVWSNFTATKCRGLVSLNQVIKEIICLQP